MVDGTTSKLIGVSWSRLRGLLDRTREGVDNAVVVTDADGTLWAGDVGEDLVDNLLNYRLLHSDVSSPLAALARHHGVSSHDDRHDTLKAIRLAFESGDFPEQTYYELSAWLVAGRSRVQVREYCEQLVQTLQLDHRVHPEMRSLVSWAREAGVQLRVVSASPAPLVRAAVAMLGIAPDEVVGGEMAFSDDDIAEPRLGRPLPYGEEKVLQLQESMGDASLLAAFGDSPFDLPMLAKATLAVAVHPKKSLAQHLPDDLQVLCLTDENS